MSRFYNSPAALCVAFATVLPVNAVAQIVPNAPPNDEGWNLRLDFGLMATPKYRGDNDYQISALPGVRLSYGDTFFASVNEGIGFNLIRSGPWRAGPIMRYDFGRDEDGDSIFRISGDRTDDLKGLGDVDGTVELGGFIEYDLGQFKTYLEVRQGLGGHEGIVGRAKVDYKTVFRSFGPPAFFSIGPIITFASSDYTSAYFDVNAAQSAASGLTVYDAGGGLTSYGINAALTMPITDRAAITAIAGWDVLTGDVADSSLVRERGSRNQGRFGVFTGFRF
ncbi:MipA/OmpV family protein [Rhodobacteraceae bacterium KMM 6894]|nr:MipA/OmpV family protein [Rhodobacteraceae bacterium KMM 6894]